MDKVYIDFGGSGNGVVLWRRAAGSRRVKEDEERDGEELVEERNEMLPHQKRGVWNKSRINFKGAHLEGVKARDVRLGTVDVKGAYLNTGTDIRGDFILRGAYNNVPMDSREEYVSLLERGAELILRSPSVKPEDVEGVQELLRRSSPSVQR